MPTPLRRFTIDQPANLSEASQMLVEFGDGGRAYAGGTELLLAMKHAGLRYEHLVDLKTIRGLDILEERDGTLRIGSLVTHRTLEHSPLVKQRLPALARLESNVANPRVRASGTLGGNLCFAEPHSDPAALLLCLDTRLEVVGPSGERAVPLEEFLVGPYEVALGEGELLESISIPLPGASQRAVYQKFQVHERPMLGLALVADLDVAEQQVHDARVAVGSASPIPRRSPAAESLLVGSFGEAAARLDDAADALADEADLVDDFDGSAAYKRHLIHVLLRRAFEEARGDRSDGRVHP